MTLQGKQITSGIERLFYLTLTLPWDELAAIGGSIARPTYRKTIAWFSERAPSLANALSAKSSAAPIALPSLPPSGPFVDEA
jgi:hypothetical protein